MPLLRDSDDECRPSLSNLSVPDIALPQVIVLELQIFRLRLTLVCYCLELIEEASLAVTPPLETSPANFEDVLGKTLHRCRLATSSCTLKLQPFLRNVQLHVQPVCIRPAGDQVLGLGQSLLVVEKADPERRERAY